MTATMIESTTSITIEDINALRALPEGTRLRDADGDLLVVSDIPHRLHWRFASERDHDIREYGYRDYEVVEECLLPAVVLNPEILGTFKPVESELSDRFPLGARVRVISDDLGGYGPGPVALYYDAFKPGATATVIDSVDWHTSRLLSVRFDRDGETRYVAEGQIELLATIEEPRLEGLPTIHDYDALEALATGAVIVPVEEPGYPSVKLENGQWWGLNRYGPRALDGQVAFNDDWWLEIQLGSGLVYQVVSLGDDTP